MNCTKSTLHLVFQLLSTSKVMASLKHPESVVRGEEVVLEVHLFNNQDKEAKVSFNLNSKKKEKYNHIEIFYNICRFKCL